MKTERRHELKTNELADWLGKSMVRVEENYKVGLAIVVVVVLLVAVWAYLRNSAAQKTQESWTAFQRASASNNGVNDLTDVANRYHDLPAGACALLMLGDMQLRTGTDQLFADRADANDQLRRALDNYQAVINSPADVTPIVKQRALLGLARAAESLNDLPRAREAYQQLADANRWPQAYYSKEAQTRLDALSRTSTKEFYDWFAKQEPRPALSPVGDGASLFQGSTLPAEPATSPATTPPADTVPATTAPPADKPADGAAETPAAETPATPPEGAAPAAPPSETPAPAPAETPAAPPATEPTPPPANP